MTLADRVDPTHQAPLGSLEAIPGIERLHPRGPRCWQEGREVKATTKAMIMARKNFQPRQAALMSARKRTSK